MTDMKVFPRVGSFNEDISGWDAQRRGRGMFCQFVVQPAAGRLARRQGNHDERLRGRGL